MTNHTLSQLTYHKQVTLMMLALQATAGPLFATASQDEGVADVRLDHVPIAVRDLDSATTTYRRLGFKTTDGRLHANSIRNVFINLPDGTQIELITATEKADSLANWYVTFLELSEGAAYAAFRTDAITSVIEDLTDSGVPFLDTGPDSESFRTVALVDLEPLRRIFFIEYTARTPASNLDRRHANTATGLTAVWLVVEDMVQTSTQLERLGWSAESVVPLQSINGLGRRFPVASGEVMLVAPTTLAGITDSYLDSRGESVMGISITVADVERARDVVGHGVGRRFPIATLPDRGRAFLVPPRFTHGLWIEFLQPDEMPDGNQ